MKRSPYLSTSLAAGAFLLASSFALAQTTSGVGNTHPRGAASGQSSAQSAQSGRTGIAVDHAGGNGVQRMAGSHNSSGNSQATQNTRSAENPLYESDKTGPGENPLYGSKDKTNSKPNSGTSTVEYKDPEDMQTRYRPGNNKTTRVDGGQNAGTSSNSNPSAGTQQRKHPAGVKYEDRMSGGGSHMQTTGGTRQAPKR